jgi:hypothetical protein
MECIEIEKKSFGGDTEQSDFIRILTKIRDNISRQKDIQKEGRTDRQQGDLIRLISFTYFFQNKEITLTATVV